MCIIFRAPTEKSSKKKELKDRFLSGLPSRHLGDRKKKSFFASSSEEGEIWLGTCLYFLSTKKELISRCVVARRSARSIFFFALQTRAKFVRFAFDGRGEIEIGKLQKPPRKLKNAHMRLPPMRESFPRTTLKKHFGLTLLTSSSSYTNRQPQTLTNNPPPGAGIGTNGGAQVDDAARKQDALSYLRHLKDRLKDRKQTYDEFLEIMKEFKAQR